MSCYCLLMLPFVFCFVNHVFVGMHQSDEHSSSAYILAIFHALEYFEVHAAVALSNVQIKHFN
jgi:hypothetical protein